MENPLWIKLKEWTQGHSLPGFFKVPIYDVVVFVFNELRRQDLISRANAAAFSYFLSVFPSLLSLFTLLPYLKDLLVNYVPGAERFDAILQSEIHKIMPGVAGDRLFTFVEDITSNPRTGLLSFGTAMALFFASNGMLAMMRGFEKSYIDTFKNRNFLSKRGIALALTVALGLLVIVSVFLIALGDIMVGLLAQFSGLDNLARVVINFLRWVVVIFLFYGGIAVLYRFGAPLPKRLSLFTPGAALATSLCIIASLVFSFYVNNFNTYNQLYGSIGTIIVLMLWIQLNSLSILIGYELNASIAINRDLKEVVHEDELRF